LLDLDQVDKVEIPGNLSMPLKCMLEIEVFYMTLTQNSGKPDGNQLIWRGFSNKNNTMKKNKE